MRTILLALAFLSSLEVCSQRVTFQDPDLSFSFKKPKNWEFFDNGYVIKVSPSAADSSTTYLTLTYFSSPKPMGGYGANEFPESLNTVNPADNIGSQPEKNGPSEKILGNDVQSREFIQDQEGEDLKVRTYTFREAGQQWEIIASAPKGEGKKFNKVFRKIMRSLRID